MKPSDLFAIGEKIQFGLSKAPEGDRYTCLVKKFRESLMAVVVSNRDKDKVSLATGDEIFLFKDEAGGTQAMPVKLVQNNAYPLVIVDLTQPAPAIEEEAPVEQQPSEQYEEAGEPEAPSIEEPEGLYAPEPAEAEVAPQLYEEAGEPEAPSIVEPEGLYAPEPAEGELAEGEEAPQLYEEAGEPEAPSIEEPEGLYAPEPAEAEVAEGEEPPAQEALPPEEPLVPDLESARTEMSMEDTPAQVLEAEELSEPEEDVTVSTLSIPDKDFDGEFTLTDLPGETTASIPGETVPDLAAPDSAFEEEPAEAPLFEMDLTGEEGMEEQPEALDEAAQAEEPAEPPLFEMDLTGEEGMEEQPEAADEAAQAEEPAEPPLFEMDLTGEEDAGKEQAAEPEPKELSEEDLTSTPPLGAPAGEVAIVTLENEEGDFGMADTSSELLFIPAPGEEGGETPPAAEAPEEGEKQSQTAGMMDTVGEEYQNAAAIDEMAITDDYLEAEPVAPEPEEEEAFVHEDGSMEEESLEETLTGEGATFPGALEMQPVKYLGVEDITESEMAKGEWEDETPTPFPDFYIPADEEAPQRREEPAPMPPAGSLGEETVEEPEAPAERLVAETTPVQEDYLQKEAFSASAEPEAIPEAFLQPEVFIAPAEDGGAEVYPAQQIPQYRQPGFDTQQLTTSESHGLAPDLEENLEATSRDINAGEISIEDIEILDEDLKNVPSLEDGDMDSGLGMPKGPGSLEEEAAEEPEEEAQPWEAGYPQVTHYPDMEMAQERDFNVDDLDKLLARGDEEDETGEPEKPVTIKDEGKRYTFEEDLEDTVKILTPFGSDESLGGFTLEDLKDLDETTPRPVVEKAEPKEEEAAEPIFEVDLAGEERGAAQQASFSSTTKIPKPSALSMISPALTAAAEGVFEDYFGFRFIQPAPETVGGLKALIGSMPTSGRRGGAGPQTPPMERISIPDTVGKDVKDALLKIMEKVSTLETMVGAPAQPAGAAAPAPTGAESTAICVSINPSGLMAAIEGNPPPQGKPLYVMIDRPWEPSLRVDALAEMVSSERKRDNINICYFRFTAINEQDKDSINDYLAGAPKIFEKIKKALKD